MEKKIMGVKMQTVKLLTAVIEAHGYTQHFKLKNKEIQL